MPVAGGSTSQNYPTLESILGLVRAIANDAFAGATNTPGEGQILTDLYQGTSTTNYNPQLLQCFNAAIREMYRSLRNVKAKALVRDNYVLENVPVVNGPLGASVPDPSVQTYLAFGGYFDGTNTTTSIALPSDMLMPLKLWERQSGTNDVFIPLREAPDGLDPVDQVDEFRVWEWRENQINFIGATIPRDIRIRYMGVLPTFFPTPPIASNYFTTTQIPILDCEESVAWLTLRNLSPGIGGAQAFALCDAQSKEQLQWLKNQEVRRMQGINYRRAAYSDSNTGEELDVYGI